MFHVKQWGDNMGIRVYIRNTADRESKNEICLGKLYAYADGNEQFDSVKYMLDNHLFLPEYWDYFNEYHDNCNSIPEHVYCLSMGIYLDYGEFAVFHDLEIFDFILRYAKDCNTFWRDEHPNYNFDIPQIWGKIIEQNERYNNNIWEIRQGA